MCRTESDTFLAKAFTSVKLKDLLFFYTIMHNNSLVALNPDCAVPLIAGLRLENPCCPAMAGFHDFGPQSRFSGKYASGPKSFQLHVSQWYSTPWYDANCTIWVKKINIKNYIIQIEMKRK